MFIRKAYETKIVTESTLIRDAVLNAMHNAYRKKGQSFRQLWTERQPVNMQQVKSDLAFIEKVEEKETGWIDKIYRNAGLIKPKQDTDKK
jgi:ribosomal protein L20